MGRQVFEADGVVLGSREIPNFRDFAAEGWGKQPERSYAYFCNQCGKVWGELHHEGAAWTTIIQRACRWHGDGRLSMQFPAGEPLGIVRDWPREALLREFLIELERAERGC